MSEEHIRLTILFSKRVMNKGWFDLFGICSILKLQSSLIVHLEKYIINQTDKLDQTKSFFDLSVTKYKFVA